MNTDSSLTPLFDAIENNDKTTVIQLLHKNPALLTITNKIGKHALHLAAQAGFPDMVKLLLDKGADPNVKDKRGFTPLHYIAFHGEIWRSDQAIAQFVYTHYEASYKLSYIGLDTNHPLEKKLYSILKQLELNSTPHHRGTQEEIVQQLNALNSQLDWATIEEPSPVNRPLLLDKPLLEEQRNYLGILDLFLQKGANVDALAKGGITPLLLMIYFNHTLLREFLLLKGANVNYITDSPEHLRYLLDSSIENMLILFSPHEINPLRVLDGIQAIVNSRWAVLSKNEKLAQKILKQTAICTIAIYQQAISLTEENSSNIQTIIQGKTNEFSAILKSYLDDETYLERRVIQHLDKTSSYILEEFKTIVAERMAIQLWKAYDRGEQLALLQFLYQSSRLPPETTQNIALNFFPPASIKEEYENTLYLQEVIREIGLHKVLNRLTSLLIQYMNDLLLKKGFQYKCDEKTIPTFIATLCPSLSLHPSLEKNIEEIIAEIAAMLGYSREWKLLNADNNELNYRMKR